MKLLIVDDEEHIRRGLEKGVLWNECGISDVKTAANGIEALDTIRAEGTDILLTDIRMPGMDGLNLIRSAIELQKNIRIVVFSGFSEFDYARSAISLGVKAYLLKPVKIPELKTIVCNLVKELEQEQKDLALQQRKMQEQELSHQLLKEQPDLPVMQSLLEQFGFREELIYCTLFEADTKEEYRSRECQKDIRQIVESIAGSPVCVLQVHQQLLWLQKAGMELSRWELQNRLERAFLERKRDKNWNSVTLSAGISEVFPLQELPKAYRECRDLLDQRLYLGKDRIILQKKAPKQSKRMFHIENADRLRQHIINFEPAKAQEFITDTFCALKDAQISSYNLTKNICLQLQQILFEAIEEIGVSLEHMLERQEQLRFVVPDYITLEEYRDWVLEQYGAMIQELQDCGRLPISNTVRKAVAYIQTHYHENISVDFISGYVGASRTYFSHKFKKEMLMSFTDYLNQIRIEKACRLLKTTLSTADEISRQVGFQDGRYFSTVFKKIMGCSPTAYRKNGAIKAEQSSDKEATR